MAVNFQPKPGKPHIRLHKGVIGYYLWPIRKDISVVEDIFKAYCDRVTPGYYKTKGDAARALHYGSKK